MAYRVVLLFVLILTGCATYQEKVSRARNHLSTRQYDDAIKILEPLAKEQGNDQLIFLFDYATALQVAGRHKESNSVFSDIEQVVSQKDYLSVSKFAGSLLLNEEMQHYRGEDFEKLLVNVMASMNYLMLRDREGALVEIRRLNEKIEYFRTEEKKEYKMNTAASYVSALLWEADKNWDSAYIDYERAYNVDSNIGYIESDLVRLAKKSDRQDNFEKFSKKFNIKAKPEWSNKNLGEIVLVYQQGWGPRKAERPRIFTSVGYVTPGLPMLVPTPSSTKRARVEVRPVGTPADKEPAATEESRFVYSVQTNAIKTLEDSYGPLIAKKVAAFIAKETTAHAVSKDNAALGAIMRIAMHAADRADLRQWSTLPETIQVARLYVPPGKYSVSIKGLLESGMNSGEDMPPVEVEIKPSEKTFLSWRSFH